MTEYYRPLSLGDTTIRIPALKRPTLKYLELHLDQKNSFEIDQILDDSSPTHGGVLELGTLLAENEDRISGAEYIRRRLSLDRLLGFQHLLWILDHQDDRYSQFKALFCRSYIDGLGLRVQDVQGNRRFPCLRQRAELWRLEWRVADDSLSWRGCIARFCKQPAEGLPIKP